MNNVSKLQIISWNKTQIHKKIKRLSYNNQYCIKAYSFSLQLALVISSHPANKSS